MASRGTFGFRAKQPEREDHRPSPAPPGLSRMGSITSNIPTTTPKLPAQSSSSFFSRSRHNKAKADAQSSRLPAPSSIPMGRGQTTANISAVRTEPGPPLKSESTRNLGLGISSEKTTVQVSKSGKARNVLRRKAPMSDSRSGYARTESSASSYEPPPSRQAVETKNTPATFTDPFADSILGITAPPVPSSSTAQMNVGLGPSFEFDTSSSRMARFNSRKGPSASPNPNLPPPTPNYAHDSGSSTRRSESPGGFSRTSTPTSMSSQSPGVSTPAKLPVPRPTARQRSPVRRTRPPVALDTVRRGRGLESSSQGLTAVRESGTSSSSSSTVKASGSRDDSSRTAISDRSSPRPFSPPSRTASQRSVLSSPGLPPLGQEVYRPSFEQRSLNATGLLATSTEGTGSSRDGSQLTRSKAPPIRPSREGVPTLILSEQEKLNLELGLPRPGAKPLGRSSSNASSVTGQRSRLPSPNPADDRPTRPRPTDPSRAREPLSVETESSTARTVKDPSPQSASSSKPASRFGFLRRNKSPDKAERAAKKGPAAGTGHEGYGKMARRGRNGSFSTSASRGRSTSSTSIGRTPSSRKSSLTSQHDGEMDDFYRDRLEPKKIVGGGQSVASSTHGSDTSLNKGAQSSADALPGEDDLSRRMFASNQRQIRAGPSTNEPSQAHALRHVGRRLPHREEPARSTSRLQHQDLNAPDEGATPTLATRRSLHRSQLLADAEPVKIPAPIDTRATAPSPAIDSQNTYQSSVPPTDSTVPLSDDISEGREGNWLTSRNKSTKSPKKWAFFNRTQPSPKKSAVPVAPKSDDDYGIRELRAKVAKVPELRPVAFYELLNQSQSEQGDLDHSQTSLQTGRHEPQYQTQTVPAATPAPATQTSTESDSGKNLSMLLPSPPTITGEFPIPVESSNTAPPPQSAPVPVAPDAEAPSALPEPRKPRLQQIGRIPRVVSKRDRTHKPPPQSFSRLRPYTPRQEPPSSAPVVEQASAPSISDRPVLGIQTERIPFSSWDAQDSAKPASAPVGSIDSIQRETSGNEFLAFSRNGSQVSAASSSSGLLSFADATAVMHQSGTAPVEEEEWNEYNDFLDIMESPAPLGNPKANPLDKINKKQGWAPAPLEIRKGSASSGDSTTKLQPSTDPPAAAPTRRLPSPPKRSNKLVSPPPVPEFSGQGSSRRSRDSEKTSSRHKRSSSRYSTSSIESEADSLAGQENIANVKVNVPAHLRLELLTISKLLSFDRVLFSPAHAEISSNRKNRILVLDGLGVDDWAFYCAQEYPDAQISNLSPVPRIVNSAKNYDHHHYPSLDGPFPFPQSFFTAAVLRFPAATSEEAYCNVIKEFRRVLVPGGYLEISILDLDMMKMGQQTRRALRELKQRKQRTEPQTSLKPLSDNIQKMLGGKAYENLKQCMLEIPVAGPVASSRVRSFNQKMELIDEMPRDEDRTKHLPEIGRWWYSRCYERGSRLPDIPPNSIWNDKDVLDECEAMETGFKMLLCYAQKPNKRRTLSL